jgi:hypothetical protein
MRKLLFVAIATMALFSACKKKDVEKTTAEKIIGRWVLVTETDNDYYNNTNHITTYPGTSSDDIDFRVDGRMYEGPTFTTSYTYSIVSDSKITIAGISSDINSLTDVQLVLHTKTSGTGTNFYEATATYRK